MNIREKVREIVGENIYDNLSSIKRYIELLLFPKKTLMDQFESNLGYRFDLNNPQTYNEKLMWLKIYWRDELATKCADKYEVRDYVRDKLKTDQYLNELIGVYNDAREIDFDSLPDKFVLKVTHGSGQNIICKDKSNLQWNKEIHRLNKWLKKSAYTYAGEWVYKNIKPRIICEKIIETINGKPPIDYKVFCFDGVPKIIFAATDRENHETKFNFYSIDWTPIQVKNYYPRNNNEVKQPEKLNEMLKLASLLSTGFPHARVDFYIENDEIIFGEITFFHFAGLVSFEPHDFDILLGGFLKLPNKRM